MQTVFGHKTLVPVSVIGVVFLSAFWIAGLSKDVEAMASEIVRIKSERSSLEAEIVQQLRSQAITLQELQIQYARSDSKMNTLISIIKKLEENEK